MSTLSFDVQQWPRAGSPFAEVTDAKSLAAVMFEKAKAQFKQKSAHATMALLVSEETVYAVHLPVSTKENERVAGGNLVQKLTHDLYAVGVGFVSEAWFVPKATEEALADRTGLLQHPDKIEVLLIQASWGTGGDTSAKAVQIVRDGNKPAQLAERPDLFTANGADGLLILKRQEEEAIRKQMLLRPMIR